MLASSTNSILRQILLPLLNTALSVEQPGRALRYRSLVRQVQGYDHSLEEARKLLKVHIHNLREKIEPLPEKPAHSGFGYLFERRRVNRETLNQMPS